ncbi:hypothetical protein W02_17380 [Nitrospira sp. KM1]|uniref:CHASE2 domain-containing protein n=1 Tax=Nitrospira sp. KM1 TaxID=1936990 RepID=UPI0013A7A374|nr:CHASE2 domain-containing protein [Nitrospira sp. KM1]BCA54598.1 hypothetical protein W02_17380 [Nitrospira sp. KM1]
MMSSWLDPSVLLKKLIESLRHRLKPLEPIIAPVAQIWRNLPSFVQLLLKSIAIGLGAAVILHICRPYIPGVVPAERSATDWAINFWKDRSVESPALSERFVFVDIDEATYQQWGEQLFVPRDKLLALIRFAVVAQAKLLVVDTELTKRVALVPAQTGGLSPREAGGDADELLKNYLGSYSRLLPQGDGAESRVPVIFVRSIGQPLLQPDADGRIPDGTQHETAASISEERPSEFLESTLANSIVLHWASALIERDDDGVVRDWRLFEPTCIKGTPNVTPSIALLAWALVRQPELDGGAFAVTRFRSGLRERFAPPDTFCTRMASAGIPDPKARPSKAWRLIDRSLGKPVVLSLNPDDLEHRVFYKFLPDSVQAELFSRVRASIITDPPVGRPLSPDWLKGKIVVIGSSYGAAHDRHVTPLGEMPGGLVVINEINALLEYGQIREPDARIRWTVLIALIMAFSLSFSYFTKSWGTRVARLIINVLFIPLSLWLFQYGWWLDIVFPLMVLQAYGLLVDFQVEPQTIKRKAASQASPR